MAKLVPHSSALMGRNNHVLPQEGPDTDQNANSMQVTIPDVISSVRDFMPNQHQGMRAARHEDAPKIKKAAIHTKMQRGPENEEQEGLRKEVEALMKQVRDCNGELNYKNQKLGQVPKALKAASFEGLLTLDIRGNEINAIEDTLC